ncbi:uncharacterized protein LOC141718291 [Apium graveolens]|uniref:uncharacterized protein LOC141718291 n=1 Tax=Apium graveolens TaxID=4045 RepID=UPI003D7A9421
MASKKTSYIGKNTSPRRNNVTPLRQPPPPPHHKVINFISGGSEVCGSTYSQANRASREINIRVTEVGVGNDNIPSLMFGESDKKNIREPQQDGLVISLPVGNCLIKRILVDNGSAANIMMLSTLTQMGLAESDMIKKSTTLVGFSGETKRTLGEITLPTYAQEVNLLELFCIIDVDSSYNIIMGRPWIHNLKAVPSTYHQVLKFPTPWGAQEIRGDQTMAQDCYMMCLKPTVQHQGDKTPVATVTGPEQLAEVDLTAGDKKVLIGEDLSPTIEANLINPSYTHVQQKRRKFAVDRNKIINDEVERLIKAGMIKEVNYPEWLANVVIIQKKNGKWRVCVDYTDLNKACPKDPYPLPHIDTMVDSMAGHELLTFLDASSGFIQIQMELSDCEKTAFITDRGIYYYLAMPFGLRNAGATFQRLVNKMFKEQIGRIMEVYIDDMVNK